MADYLMSITIDDIYKITPYVDTTIDWNAWTLNLINKLIKNSLNPKVVKPTNENSYF